MRAFLTSEQLNLIDNWLVDQKIDKEMLLDLGPTYQLQGAKILLAIQR